MPNGSVISAHAIFAGPVSQNELQPKTALIASDRAQSAELRGPQRAVRSAADWCRHEFHLSKRADSAYLTSVFLVFYMCGAVRGPAGRSATRASLIIVLGALFWSGLTLLTAVTHDYTELLIRHTLVGIGEATFVTIAPTFVADLFPGASARTHSRRVLLGDSCGIGRWGICSAGYWRRTTAGVFLFILPRFLVFYWLCWSCFFKEPDR